MISYIFHIGIIYIVFSLIWTFFLLIYNLFVGFTQSNSWQTFVIKSVKTYFLISILAIYTIHFMRDPRYSAPFIATVGLLTLYSYLVGRLQRKQMILQINNRMGNFGNAGQNADMRLEMILVALGLIYFTICLFDHSLPFNKINNWFYRAVNDIYETPVIGWIIGFFGILFLISVLVKAFLATALFIQRITAGNKPNDRDKNNNNNDDYTDYEIID